MNERELRLGNYLMSDKGVVTVTYLGADGPIESSVKPIPLTEEWLKRLGFTPDKEHGLVYDHPTPKNPEDEHKDLGTNYPAFFFNKRLNRWMDCHTRVCVDTVHGLQNLYFALTGEELKLKTYDSK